MRTATSAIACSLILIATAAVPATIVIREPQTMEVLLNGTTLLPDFDGGTGKRTVDVPETGWARLTTRGRPEQSGDARSYRVDLHQQLKLSVARDGQLSVAPAVAGDRCLLFGSPNRDSFWTVCAEFERPIPPGVMHRLDGCAVPGERGDLFYVRTGSQVRRIGMTGLVVADRPGLYKMTWNQNQADPSGISVEFVPDVNCPNAPKVSAVPKAARKRPKRGIEFVKIVDIGTDNAVTSAELGRLIPALKKCHDALLLRPDAWFDAAMEIALEVAPDGTAVADITVSENTDLAFERCVEQSLSRARYPAIDAGTREVGLEIWFR